MADEILKQILSSAEHPLHGIAKEVIASQQQNRPVEEWKIQALKDEYKRKGMPEAALTATLVQFIYPFNAKATKKIVRALKYINPNHW